MKIKLINLIFYTFILNSKLVFAANLASSSTIAINKQASIPLNSEFANSSRGFIGNIANSTSSVIDMKQFSFESGANPPEVNPSLWQQALLNKNQGLFKVTASIYQVRGYDISNMSIIEGKTGIIVIDPLTSKQAAKSAIDLYYKYRPRLPIAAVIYTHPHVDHFGGVQGLVTPDDVRTGKVQIIAPQNFLQNAISENIFAGNAMSRRSYYMYGLDLKAGPTGFVDEGLGKAFSKNGTVTLIAPTKLINKTDTILNIAGVIMQFQLTPDTEAPTEMNIYFPQFKALDMAENSSKTLHNFYTLRGAQVRDSKSWEMYLDQSIKKFGNKTLVMFTQHTWPTWGKQQIVEQLNNQRDEILYIHDQTLRLANMGYTANKIADTIKLPDELSQYSYNRGYYGSVKHDARAVYQKYLGCYDSNPANLDPLPEVSAAKKYVEYMGGSSAILKRAAEDYKQGNYRWVASVMNQLVFAEPNNKAARELEANALEQLGYQSEAAPWRNEYLVGANELRGQIKPPVKVETITPEITMVMTIPQFFDNLAIHLNPANAKGANITANWIFTDTKQKYTTILHNSVLRYETGLSKKPDYTIRLNKTTLIEILSGKLDLKNLAKQSNFTGDKTKFENSANYFDKFSPGFNIIEP